MNNSFEKKSPSFITGLFSLQITRWSQVLVLIILSAIACILLALIIDAPIAQVVLDDLRAALATVLVKMFIYILVSSIPTYFMCCLFGFRDLKKIWKESLEDNNPTGAIVFFGALFVSVYIVSTALNSIPTLK